MAFDNSQLHTGSGYVADQSGYGMADPSQHYYPVLSSSSLNGLLPYLNRTVIFRIFV